MGIVRSLGAWLSRTWGSGALGKAGIIIGALLLLGICGNLAGGPRSIVDPTITPAPPRTAEATEAPAPTDTPEPASSPTTAATSLPGGLYFLTKPGQVTAGSTAIISVHANPGAQCSIVVELASGPSQDDDLSPRAASTEGVAIWAWGVRANTTPGTWPVRVTCDGETIETTIAIM